MDLFDYNFYYNLMLIFGVLDCVCICNRNGVNDGIGIIECIYGIYKDCKFLIGKKFYCILNLEG